MACYVAVLNLLCGKILGWAKLLDFDMGKQCQDLDVLARNGMKALDSPA